MYRIDRNNFYQTTKKSDIATPQWVSEWLFKLLNPHIKKGGIIFDPCVGEGSLLEPWKSNNYNVWGVDIKDCGFPNTEHCNYLEMTDLGCHASLVIMNPPFNMDEETTKWVKNNCGGRPLLPELWLKKTIELFGKDIPIVLICPYGFRLNQKISSSRWQSFDNGSYPPITSIVSLPKDVFKDILFHTEILIFNLPQLKGHYFVSENI